MILQVLPDTRQRMHDRHPVPGQLVRRPHARQHQQLRRVKRSAAEHDFACGANLGAHPRFLVLNAHGRGAFKHNAARLCAGHHRQVGAGHHRMQVSRSGRAALAVAGGVMKLGDLV